MVVSLGKLSMLSWPPLFVNSRSAKPPCFCGPRIRLRTASPVPRLRPARERAVRRMRAQDTSNLPTKIIPTKIA